MAGRMRAFGSIAGAASMALLAACVPIFTAGVLQTLTLKFRFDNAIPAGESTVVHTAVFPENVKVKNSFVQVSGKLEGGGALPGSVRLEAELADLATGKVSQRISLVLAIGDDGAFKANSKIKKNLKADELMTVALEPRGGDIPKNTAITLCVDLVEKRGDLAGLPDCVPDDGGNGGDDPPAAATSTLASLQADFFTPTCARGGCHSQLTASAGLVLEDGLSFGNLVNVRSSEIVDLDRVTPNDPDNSYLIKKLRGDPDIQGSRMPLGGRALSQAEIQRFVDWINEGARDN